MTDDLKYDCHIAALKAIDKTMSEHFHMAKTMVWIKDHHLDELLPALDRAIDAALTEFRSEQRAGTIDVFMKRGY